MVSFALNEDQSALKELCQNFGESLLQPIADELDRKASEDPEGPFPWNILKEFSALGLKNLPLPEKWNGANMGVLTHCVLLEELMAAEAGFAATVHLSWKLAGLLLECGTEEQKSKYISMFAEDETFLFGDGTLGPITSSDNQSLTATPEGSGWVLNGKKRFVGCGPLSKFFILDARTNGTSGGSNENFTFIVPRTAPGIRAGKVHDKMGMRTFLESELDFEECHVPGEDVLSDGAGNGTGPKSRYFGRITPTLGAFGVGIARAALEKATKHALERVQGGKPIFEHDIVSFRLAEMKVRVDVARDLVWRAAWHSDNQGDSDPKLGINAVLFSSEIAPYVCDSAIHIFGGYGFMRDYPVQKYWRDALGCLFHGETHDSTRLMLGRLIETETI